MMIKAECIKSLKHILWGCTDDGRKDIRGNKNEGKRIETIKENEEKDGMKSRQEEEEETGKMKVEKS